MANTGEIVIRFDNTEKDNVDASGENKKKDDKTLGTALTVLALKKAYNLVKKITVDEVKYQINRHYQMTDNYLGQQDAQLALQTVNEVISDGLGLALAVKLGLKTGSPIGVILTTSIYAGGLVATKAIQNNRKMQEERLNINKMNTELQFNRQRAGYSLTVGATGENK